MYFYSFLKHRDIIRNGDFARKRVCSALWYKVSNIVDCSFKRYFRFGYCSFIIAHSLGNIIGIIHPSFRKVQSPGLSKSDRKDMRETRAGASISVS